MGKIKKIILVLLPIILIVIFFIVACLNIDKTRKISLLEEKNSQINSAFSELKNKFISIEKELEGKKLELVGKDFWNYYEECKNSCYQYAPKLKKANLQNKCLEDCRKEMTRVEVLVRNNSEVDLESEFKKDFYLGYMEMDKPLTYTLINSRLTFSVTDDAPQELFAQSVYKGVYNGKDIFRVVPFPYINSNKIEDDKTVEIELTKIVGVHEMVVYEDKELDCALEENTEICNYAISYTTRDIAEGMILTCGDPDCNLLKAIRTKNKAHCQYMGVNPLLKGGTEWVESCDLMIDEIEETITRKTKK